MARLQIAADNQDECIQTLTNTVSASDTKTEQLSSRLEDLQKEQTEQFSNSKIFHESTTSELGRTMRNDMIDLQASMQANLCATLEHYLSRNASDISPTQAPAGAAFPSPMQALTGGRSQSPNREVDTTVAQKARTE